MEIKLTDENFNDEVILSKTPILVDFFATWCEPCRMMEPIISEIAKDYEGKLKVGKVNVDENTKTASAHSIMAIPALILFKDGKVFEKTEGFQEKESLEKIIKKVME